MNFVNRSDEILMLHVGYLIGEHCLLLGPPGTAKTALVQEFAQCTGAKFFHRLLTAFSTPEEVLGPVDLEALQRGEYRRVVEGFLPTAEVAFLDEVFKANSAILNALLDVMEYRRLFISPSQELQLPLKMMVGASNEYPEDSTLAAFADRFLLRKVVEYVPDTDFERLLKADGEPVQVQRPGIDWSSVDLETVIPLLSTLRTALRQRGMILSDRRWVKSLKVVAAHAAIAGKTVATNEDVLALRWLLPPVAVGELTLDRAEQLLYDVAVPEVAQAREVLKELERTFAEVDSMQKAIEFIARADNVLKSIKSAGDSVAPYRTRLLELRDAALHRVTSGLTVDS